jgi:cell division protease FtsH
MNKQRKNAKLLIALFFILLAIGLIPISSARFFANTPLNIPQTPMQYSEFVQAVEAKQIERVVLTSDRATALVTKGEVTYRVNLPPDTNLIDKLTRNNVDIAVRPPQDQNPIVRLLKSLLFPLLLPAALLTGLFFLLLWLQGSTGS